MLTLAQVELESYLQTARASLGLAPVLAEASAIVAQAVHGGRKLLLIGNGGSAAAAQHIAAELAGRPTGVPLAALALTTDTSTLTAIANDQGYERVFEKQIRALACQGDVLLAISTSGNSPNILRAAVAAREHGCKVIALIGAGRGALADLADVVVQAPSNQTTRVQEVHVVVGHIICRIVEAWPTHLAGAK